ncbi:hypothetical protein [Lentzea sp. NPDC055074]
MTDVRDFRGACHEAARRTGGKVVEFRLADGVTPNFHQGLVDCGGRIVAVVCTRDSKVLAGAEPHAVGESGPLTFVDAPELVAVLSELLPGVRVLTRFELDGPFDAAAWPHLSPNDATYWRPGTLGEALFNYWD